MIYIIIPTYNRITQTLSCLKSVYDQNFKDFKVILIDDGSTDNTALIVNKQYPDVTILNGTGELYWTGAVHYGINYVLRKFELNDWVLLLNNDVILDEDSIKTLHDVGVEKQRKYIINALSIDAQDKRTIIKSGTIVRSWLWNWTHHLHHGKPYSSLTSLDPIEVDLLTGRCLLHPIEVFLQAGNYDNKHFPHYGGDDEFSSRVKKYGYSLAVVPKSKVYLDTKSTGIKGTIFKNGLMHLLKSLFDIRSSSNIITKFKFTNKVVPLYARPTYYTIAVLKSIALLLR